MKLPQLPTKEPIRGLLSVPWLSFFTGLLGYIKELPTQTQIATVQQISSDALRNLKEIDLINEVAAQTATISGEIHTAVDEVRTILEDELAIARAEIEAGYTAADAVIDAEVTTLSATVGTVQADLATELITRADADSALSASITTLTSSVGTTNANLTAEAITRADADSALSASITTLNTSLGTTNANLTAEAITRASADSALTGSFTTLSSTVGTVQSDLSTEMVTRANADSALSASITTLTSNLGTTNANLSAEAITRANDDSALSASITSLSTTVGGHTTSISSLTSTTNGLNAVYGVTINNNGHVSGFALNSTAASNGGLPTSAFVIQADKFVLIDPGTAYTSGNSPPTANIPFAVIGGVTYIKSANIQDLTIGTNHLGANAVTSITHDQNTIGAVTAGTTYYFHGSAYPSLMPANERYPVLITINLAVPYHATNSRTIVAEFGITDDNGTTWDWLGSTGHLNFERRGKYTSASSTLASDGAYDMTPITFYVSKLYLDTNFGTGQLKWDVKILPNHSFTLGKCDVTFIAYKK